VGHLYDSLDRAPAHPRPRLPPPELLPQRRVSVLFDDSIRRVLVTGGAGFIGSHVTDALIAEGRRVTVIDNLSSGQRRWLEPHIGKPNFRLVEADLLDLDVVTAEMPGNDLVWHLAANTDIPSGFTRTDLDIKNCVLATHNVLEAMRATGVQRILFSSTGAIYGELCRRDTSNETAAPLLPLSLYAAGKLSCEAFISAYCHLFGLRGWMFRFGNVIGYRMSHGVIFDFIEKLRANPRRLEILGDGRQEKNYFLVEECIAGMAHAFRHAPIDADHPVDLFNLGTDSVTGVQTIASLIIEEMGLDGVDISFTGGERGWPGDQPQVHITSAKMNAMGWRAERTSNEAVRLAARRVISDGRNGE
jgi:UDP-glucose 4-epimerase